MQRYLCVMLVVISINLGCSHVSSDSVAISPNLEYIDPTIGNVPQLLVPTRPTTHLPNELIRMHPMRKDYLDDQISSFPLTIVSHRLGEVFSIKPLSGNLSQESWNQKMPWDHNLEITRPWYYSTYLIRDGITVEFTPGKKTGYYRFTFAQAKVKSLLFSAYNDGESSFQFLSSTELTGTETYHGDIKIYMYGKFNTPGTAEILENGQLKRSSLVSGKFSKAAISFPAGSLTVELKYGISFVSAAQAKRNYENEISEPNFETMKISAEQNWSGIVSQIQVEGGTEAQRRSFYTALYRCHERMVNITEDSMYYSGYNKQVNKDARPFYVDDWSWDTYLALHPLRMILHPAQEEDMLQSYVRMYEQSGWMPSFPVLFGDHACMNGFHSSVIFLDAYRKGLKNFDLDKAYEGIRKNSLEATLIPWRNGAKDSA